MLILDNNNKALILEDIFTPITSDYFWVFDLEMMDYTLTPLLVLEEINCPTIVVMVNGFCFNLPANWNILIFDDDTCQLDIVEISELAGSDFTVLSYGPNKNNVDGYKIQTINYFPTYKNIAPSLHKHQLLCYPISNDSWINISPSDGYNKYLNGCVIGDLI